MDLNTKIIDGVRQFPSLYDNKANLDERNQAWMQLAEKLTMQEVYLKIRWHSLLQAYQRNENFKYSNNMHFVKRNTETHNKVEGWPEFIITEQDLKDDIAEEQEEFVFLELDEEDHKAKDMSQEPAKEKKSNNKEIEKKEETFKKDFRTKNEATTEPTKTVQSEIKNVKEVTLKGMEEKMAAVDVNKNDEVNIKEDKPVAVDKPQHLPTERCEDVIFGELVSAMLKRMDDDKKNNIKKEIMNLLFS